MKIRAASELSEALDESLAWRRKELSTFLLLHDSSRDHEKAILRRSLIPILYSHWEGFIKIAAVLYWELVARQKLRYHELKSCFVAVSLRKMLCDAEDSQKTWTHIAVAEFLLFNQGNMAKLPLKGVIDAESNLTSAVFRNMLETIGLICDEKWTATLLLIDGSLVKTRNEVAHGERVDVDEATYKQLHRLVMDALDYMRTTVENAAILKTYLRQ